MLVGPNDNLNYFSFGRKSDIFPKQPEAVVADGIKVNEDSNSNRQSAKESLLIALGRGRGKKSFRDISKCGF
jgi:hypothetical protein